MLPLLGLAFMGANLASAHGWFSGGLSPDEIATHQQSMFDAQATMLGISVDELKDKWAEGKTLHEIAEEKGITAEQLRERMMLAKKDQLKAHLQTLVEKGIITQAQADKRASVMEQRLQSGTFKQGRHMMHGFMGF